jgi:hypothetical protein
MINCTITIDGETITVYPYNIDDMSIKCVPVDKIGAWQWLFDVDEILIGGISKITEYMWLYDRLIADKCRMCYVDITCDNITYAFKFNYWSSEFDLDNCIITIKGKYSLPNYEAFDALYSNEYNITEHVADTFATTLYGAIPFPNAKRLRDILDYVCGQIGISWQSDILTNAVTPMPFAAGSFYDPFLLLDLSTTNVYNNLIISQSPAAAGDIIELSIENILQFLAEETIDLRWKFDELTNTLIIEHYKYWQNSESYTLPAQIGVDATIIDAGKWLKETNNYKINESKLLTKERWKPQVTPPTIIVAPLTTTLTYGMVIKYDCAAIPFKENTINNMLETQVLACSFLGEKQLLLLACDINDFVWQYAAYGSYIVNHPFHPRVLFKFRTYGRPFLQGVMNGYDTTMESTSKCMFNSIELPMCCEVIDPYKLVKTDLGDGHIEDYELNLSTGMVKFSLKYEDI